MSSTETLCTHCNAKLNIAHSMLGNVVRCPACEFTFEAEPIATDTIRYESTAPRDTSHEAAESEPKPAPNSNLNSESEPNVTSAKPEGPWFIRVPEGQEFGPISREELDTWVSQGRVDHHCSIRASDDDWEPADVVYPELNIDGSPFGLQPTSAQVNSSLEPHRGAFVLGLAAVGCVVPFLSVWPAVLGTRDLRQMALGKMDPSGDAMTRSGQAIAMVSSMIWIGAFAIALLALLIRMLGSL